MCHTLPQEFILKLLNRISSLLSPAPLLKIYKTTISPILDYDFIVRGFCTKKNSDFPERLQNETMSTHSQ